MTLFGRSNGHGNGNPAPTTVVAAPTTMPPAGGEPPRSAEARPNFGARGDALRELFERAHELGGEASRGTRVSEERQGEHRPRNALENDLGRRLRTQRVAACERFFTIAQRVVSERECDLDPSEPAADNFEEAHGSHRR